MAVAVAPTLLGQPLHGAKKRNRLFDIEDEEEEEAWSDGDCHGCGGHISSSEDSCDARSNITDDSLSLCGSDKSSHAVLPPAPPVLRPSVPGSPSDLRLSAVDDASVFGDESVTLDALVARPRVGHLVARFIHQKWDPINKCVETIDRNEFCSPADQKLYFLQKRLRWFHVNGSVEAAQDKVQDAKEEEFGDSVLVTGPRVTSDRLPLDDRPPETTPRRHGPARKKFFCKACSHSYRSAWHFYSHSKRLKPEEVAAIGTCEGFLPGDAGYRRSAYFPLVPPAEPLALFFHNYSHKTGKPMRE